MSRLDQRVVKPLDVLAMQVTPLLLAAVLDVLAMQVPPVLLAAVLIQRGRPEAPSTAKLPA